MEKYILQVGELTWSKVVVAGLIAAGVYWGLYYDDGSSIEQEIQNLSGQYTESERQLRETKDAMADAEKFEKAVRQNEVQFEKVLAYLPQEINANELTRLVNQQAQISGARVQSTKSIDIIEKKDFYEMVRLEFAIQGTFAQGVSFLSSLSKTERLLTFDKLTLKAGRVAADEVPMVELAGTLVAYRYLKEAAAAGGNPAGGANVR